jgi:hypothetical protein
MFVVFYAANLYNCVFMTCSTFYCLYDTLMDSWGGVWVRACMHAHACAVYIKI